MLTKRSATVIPVTETVTQRAIELMETFTLSHGLQMGDALIAATALELNVPILTANVKHFGIIPMLSIEASLP
jgi:predicted nucleic acid-binding protein